MAKILAFLLFLLPGNAEPSLDCAKCHAAVAASYAATAHAKASSPATAQSILGSFADGSNVLRTSAPGVFFRMEQQDGSFFQTGQEPGKARTERFDLVIGSGRRGQSYLYWREGLLFQLPVSYHTSTNRWINSPGYVDGEVHFERGIPPQCLGCHAANFQLERAPNGSVRYQAGYQLGIGCAQCHGTADRHERLQRPGIDACARCHSGLEHEGPPEPDVHGNQVGLLRASRCFKSGKMTCTTCHNVHQTQRDAESFSIRCQSCHAPASCPQARRETAAAARCVSCHMPVLPSKLIAVQSYRTHRIAVYRKK